jgi:hypothetical protein
MGDQYAAIAAAAPGSLAKSANTAEAAKYYGIAARLERDPYPAVPVSQHEIDDETLVRLGFTPSYYLCKHPAWPDPLHIWPSTAGQAKKTFEEHPHPDAYVVKTWAGGPSEVVHEARSMADDANDTRES